VTDGGVLKEGNRADLIVIDLMRAHLVPALRVVSDFVHNGQARDVRSVMVDGKWLMKDGKVQTIDEKKVLADAQEIATRSWSRQFKERIGTVPPSGFNPAALP
jgi:cytosine/adenosine deaminase-related metal-dependent hydrolase